MRELVHLAGRRHVRFLREDKGGPMVEFALVIALVLLLFFAILDFGRVGYVFVTAQKAVQNAARLAVVSPPACAGVPTEHVFRDANVVDEFGTQCSAASKPCKVEAEIACLGSNATATAIHGAVAALLPPGYGADSLRYAFTYDERLGFLGGPYTPIVSVDLVEPDSVPDPMDLETAQGVSIQLVSPLGRLLQLVGGGGPGPFDNGNFRLPVISVSMPGEDLG